jgi:hypothetical protein
MPRESRKDLLRRYKHHLDIARNFREEQGYDQSWQRLIDLYRGRHFSQSMSAEDRIAVNLMFSTINVIYPAVSVNHPKITVQPNDPMDEERATILEAVLNYWWRHYDVHPEFRRATKDFLIFGHGWLKIGYHYVEKHKSITPEERERLFQEQVAQADAYALENPELAGDLPTDEEIDANLPETDLLVVEDRPFVERVSPFDIFVNPEATSLDDLQFLAQRIIRPLEDVKADERYRASVRKKLKADAALTVPEKIRGQERTRDDDIDRVTLWEYYDVKSGTFSVCAEGADEFLVDPTPIPYVYGLPFVMFRNYEVPDHFYPMGELEQLESLQQELNKTRSQMMNHRKKQGRKYLFYERAFGPEGRQALASEVDNTFVPVVDETVPLREVVVPLEASPLSADTYNYSELIEDDIDKISGVSEYARGAPPDIRRTATEAALIQDAQNARSADKLTVVEEVVSQVARRLVQLAQQFLQGEHVARVTGENGATIWVPYNRDDIIGEFDFAVEGGSTQPNNESFRRQQALSLMQAVGPLVGTVIKPDALARHVLQEGFDIRNPEKFIYSQEEQMMAQMGIPPGTPPEMAAMMMGGGMAPEGAPPEEGGEGAPPPSEGEGGGGEEAPPAPPPEGPPQGDPAAAGAEAPPPDDLESLPPEQLMAILQQIIAEQGGGGGAAPPGGPPMMGGFDPMIPGMGAIGGPPRDRNGRFVDEPFSNEDIAALGM